MQHSQTEVKRLRKAVDTEPEIVAKVLRLAYLLSWDDRYMGNQDIEDFYRDLEHVIKG